MFFFKSEKSTNSAAAIRTSTGVALRYHRSDPEKTSILEIANLQGLGQRESSRMPSESLRQTAMKQTEF